MSTSQPNTKTSGSETTRQCVANAARSVPLESSVATEYCVRVARPQLAARLPAGRGWASLRVVAMVFLERLAVGDAYNVCEGQVLMPPPPEVTAKPVSHQPPAYEAYTAHVRAWFASMPPKEEVDSTDGYEEELRNLLRSLRLPKPLPPVAKPEERPRTAAAADAINAWLDMPIERPPPTPEPEPPIEEATDELCQEMMAELIEQMSIEVSREAIEVTTATQELVHEAVDEFCAEIAAMAMKPLPPIEDATVEVYKEMAAEVVEEISVEVTREAIAVTEVTQELAQETVDEMCAEIAAEKPEPEPEPEPLKKKKWTFSLGNKIAVKSALDAAANSSAFRKARLGDADEAKASGAFDQDTWDELYSAEALDARVSLRYATDVGKYLRKWTKGLDAHAESVGWSRTEINQEAYSFVFFKVSLALTAAPTQAELRKTVEEDWEHDSRGAKVLSYEQLKDSLFEVCDVFTLSTESKEYCEFLGRLFACVYRDGKFLDDDQIVRGKARPPGFEEDEKEIKARMHQEALEEAKKKEKEAAEATKAEAAKKAAEEAAARKEEERLRKAEAAQKAEEEKARKAEEEARKKEEAARKKEEAERKAAAKKAAEEARKKAKAEEAARKAEEHAKKQAAEAEARALKKAEEAAKKEAEEVAKKEAKMNAGAEEAEKQKAHAAAELAKNAEVAKVAAELALSRAAIRDVGLLPALVSPRVGMGSLHLEDPNLGYATAEGKLEIITPAVSRSIPSPSPAESSSQFPSPRDASPPRLLFSSMPRFTEDMEPSMYDSMSLGGPAGSSFSSLPPADNTFLPPSPSKEVAVTLEGTVPATPINASAWGDSSMASSGIADLLQLPAEAMHRLSYFHRSPSPALVVVEEPPVSTITESVGRLKRELRMAGVTRPDSRAILARAAEPISPRLISPRLSPVPPEATAMVRFMDAYDHEMVDAGLKWAPPTGLMFLGGGTAASKAGLFHRRAAKLQAHIYRDSYDTPGPPTSARGPNPPPSASAPSSPRVALPALRSPRNRTPGFQSLAFQQHAPSDKQLRPRPCAAYSFTFGPVPPSTAPPQLLDGLGPRRLTPRPIRA